MISLFFIEFIWVGGGERFRIDILRASILFMIQPRANGTKETTKALNAYLDDLQKKVYEAHTLLTEADKMVTAESIRNKFLGKGSSHDL